MERRLAAIVSADIVGYSRLIDLDEAGTHGRVMALIEALKALIAQRGGRIIKTTGDGALVTFDSVVDAVECAIEAQRELADTADDVPAGRRLYLRIGVNLGDIIIEDGDVYGQGVNIAVRLQEVAKSGAVYVSRGAVEQARGKVAARFRAGRQGHAQEHRRAGRGLRRDPRGAGRDRSRARRAAPFAAADRDGGRRGADRGGRRGRRVVVHAPRAVRATGRRSPAIAPSPPRDDSIAVLPFADLGGKEDSALIVDGVFDDLITDLSKLSELTVLAANSVNGYRGRDVAPLAVADELAVRYVLEGSVRQVAEDLRINVRLIDSRERKNAWAQSYEGPITDIFKFQDNMVENIVSSLAIKVSEAERGRVLARETASIPAYEAFRRGQAALLLKTPDNLPGGARRRSVRRSPSTPPTARPMPAWARSTGTPGSGAGRTASARPRTLPPGSPGNTSSAPWSGRPPPPTSSPRTSASTPGSSTIRSTSPGSPSSSRRAIRRATW